MLPFAPRFLFAEFISAPSIRSCSTKPMRSCLRFNATTNPCPTKGHDRRFPCCSQRRCSSSFRFLDTDEAPTIYQPPPLETQASFLRFVDVAFDLFAGPEGRIIEWHDLDRLPPATQRNLALQVYRAFLDAGLGQRCKACGELPVKGGAEPCARVLEAFDFVKAVRSGHVKTGEVEMPDETEPKGLYGLKVGVVGKKRFEEWCLWVVEEYERKEMEIKEFGENMSR